jgi:hypothetical protein
MVFGVVPVIKPQQIVPFGVRAYSPGNRLVGIAAIMKEKAIQKSATVSQIIKGKKKDPELPIQNEADSNSRPENNNLSDSPPRIDPVFPFDFLVDGPGIVSQVAQKNVSPRVLWLSVMPKAIN